jgi:levansucrase
MSIRTRGRIPRMMIALLAVTGAVLIGAPAHAAPQSANDAPTTQQQFPPDANFTATWQYAAALQMHEDATNTAPLIPPNFPIMTNQVWIWDTWPLTAFSDQPVLYQGWHVIFSLTAPRTIGFGDRHWVARIGFFYSRDGKSWIYGGALFPPGHSLGAREWAGSAQLVGNNVYAFYTASGHDGGGANPNDTLQRLAMSIGQIHADQTHVWFTGFTEHHIILEPDGVMYQTQAQSLAGPIIYAFRDPGVFRNPADGKIYMTFEGNTGGVAGAYTCTPRDLGNLPPGTVVSPDSKYYTGNIGLAAADDASLTSWHLLPPLLSANCVNQQTERPHVLFRGDRVYLWTISHKFTFYPGLTDLGNDGVYGFVGPSLRSDYKPLNGSALVIGNPPAQPTQQYSEYVMRNGMVESFIDTIPLPGGVRFGGTLARTLQLALNGNGTTKIAAQLDYGFIP